MNTTTEEPLSADESRTPSAETGPGEDAAGSESDLEIDPSEQERPGIWALALPSILGNLSYAAVGMWQTKVISA